MNSDGRWLFAAFFNCTLDYLAWLHVCIWEHLTAIMWEESWEQKSHFISLSSNPGYVHVDLIRARGLLSCLHHVTEWATARGVGLELEDQDSHQSPAFASGSASGCSLGTIDHISRSLPWNVTIVVLFCFLRETSSCVVSTHRGCDTEWTQEVTFKLFVQNAGKSGWVVPVKTAVPNQWAAARYSDRVLSLPASVCYS